jgi:cyclin H
MKPLRKKLQKCRDPDRANLVNLQRARREQAMNKEKKTAANNDGSVFGDDLARETKRVKLENADPFGPPL